MGPGPVLRRRSLVAGTAGAMAATAGCVSELQSIVGREEAQPLSLTIATLPESNDPYAIRIANELAENLERAGIEFLLDPMSPDVLFREILVNHDYDLYVARYPLIDDPDRLRTLLHSQYTEETGWQNPFGFSDLGMDELLDDQRRASDEERVDRVRRIQERVVRDQPFTVVARADRIAAYRTERFEGWARGGPAELEDYLRLEGVGEAETIRLLLRDARVTRNRNPIAAEHRDPSDVMDLLYEPLTRTPGQRTRPVPWLAREVDWDTDGGAATVTLRETYWHDGDPVTAGDVAFTYEFLWDTSLGAFETPAATPWGRGRVSLVEDVTARDDETVRLAFSVTNREVAERALEVTILPEHVWRERTDPADVGPIDIAGQTTEALVTANEDTVGSGPLQFVEASRDEELVLETVPDHFLGTGDTDGIPAPLEGGLPFERAVFEVMPSHDAALERLSAGPAARPADATADGLQAQLVPDIVRNDDIELSIADSSAFYHVGYNCRRSPMTNPRFRRTIARLVDREHLVRTAFSGYADPSEVPVGGQWTPRHLTWDGSASLPFLGERGVLDVEAAREAFRDAGFQYDDGTLVHGDA